MNYFVAEVGTPRKAYPDPRSPEVRGRLLPLADYVDMARGVIGRLARPADRATLLGSEDAVGHVAGRLMLGDWGFRPELGVPLRTYRGRCGKGAIGECLDNLRRARRDLAAPLEADPEHRPQEAGGEEDEEKARYARTLLSSTTPAQRRYLKMLFYEGLTPAEIGGRAGVSPHVVRRMIGGGIAAMREAAGVA